MTGDEELNPDARLGADELALKWLPMVGPIVDEFAARVPRSVRYDELTSGGLVALSDAARSFEPERDGQFEVYAGALIRSALLEVIRASQEREVEDRVPASPGESVFDAVDADARLGRLREAISELSDRHRRVISGFFLEHEPEAGIAAELGVAEAQVVQLRTEALMLLRDALAASADESTEPYERNAARRAMYGALASRRTLLRASSMSDTEELQFEA
jgi:RNA polymerase sigma factor FliA